MGTPQFAKKLIANLILQIKKKELQHPNVKFLVFTGTAGKTTTRHATSFVLNQSGYTTNSNSLGYSNEIGVLLTALGISKFSFKNPLDWLKLFITKNTKQRFVCIELGADFYCDIPWFLKHFTPFTVFISDIGTDKWTNNMEKVAVQRKQLLESVPQNGFIVYKENKPINKLIQNLDIKGKKITTSIENPNAATFVQKWNQNIFTKPLTTCFKTKDLLKIRSGEQVYTIEPSQPLFEPQVYALLSAIAFCTAINNKNFKADCLKEYHFPPQRLQFYDIKNKGTILEDTYKATPLCTFWLLKAVQQIKATKKILIISEMRPLTKNKKFFYAKLGKLTKFAHNVYFIGPQKYYDQVHHYNNNVKLIATNDYQTTAQKIIQQSNNETLILLKGSNKYNLSRLKQLLIQK